MLAIFQPLSQVGSVAAGQAPIKVVVFHVEESEKLSFFNSISNFSQKYGFEIEIYPTTPDGKYFTIEMHNTDIKLAGGNTFAIEPKEKVTLAFYTDDESRENILYAEFISRRMILEMDEFDVYEQ
ncbi:hypothetical protein NKG95_33635 [Mesorhizobium sp. M1423]|uniref:hypothetical protein n=1 Tax=Mesorhizobium sp. M1423 TaxID=2957101 RepID=UPI00333DC2BF